VNEPSYKYNASDEGLRAFNSSFTSRNGDGTDDPEENFFSILKLAACCKSGGNFLDVGSGHGRIVDIVLPYAGHVVALEPDVDRFQSCRNAFTGNSTVDVQNVVSSEYKAANPGKRFDLITLSMVQQHISTRQSRELLDDVRDLLAPRGIAVIATTHLRDETFLYSGRSVPVTVDEFDRYAENPACQDWGIPVRMFSKKSFHEAVQRAALEIIVWNQFSYVRSDRMEAIAALYGVKQDAIHDVGTSQFVAVSHRRTP
jgi:SAM-dependent methyltransferase